MRRVKGRNTLIARREGEGLESRLGIYTYTCIIYWEITGLCTLEQGFTIQCIIYLVYSLESVGYFAARQGCVDSLCVYHIDLWSVHVIYGELKLRR